MKKMPVQWNKKNEIVFRPKMIKWIFFIKMKKKISFKIKIYIDKKRGHTFLKKLKKYIPTENGKTVYYLN